MRVLHVFDHSIPLQSGYAFRSLQIIRSQRNVGIDTYHITGSRQIECRVNEETIEGIKFYRTVDNSITSKKNDLFRQIHSVVLLRERLSNVVEEVAPDIVHVHSPVLNFLSSINIVKSRKIPIAYEVRAFWEDAAVDHGTTRTGSMRYLLSRFLETYAMKRSSSVFTICKGLKNEIEARGISSNRIHIVPNAISEDLLNEEVSEEDLRDLRLRLGLNDHPVIGFIGSFYAYEGLPILVKAMDRISEVYPKARLLLVGGGPDLENILRSVSESRTKENILVIGRVSHHDVLKYYGIIDVLVYPRKPIRLTEIVTPLKPLEAMARKKPVVVSDVGGHLELVTDGETGLVFKSGDIEDLANKVVKLLLDNNLRMSIVDRARIYVTEKRNWSHNAEIYHRVYKTMLGG